MDEKYVDYGKKVVVPIPAREGKGMLRYCKPNPKCPEWAKRMVNLLEFYEKVGVQV